MPYSSYGWNALGVAQARQGQLQEALDSLNQGTVHGVRAPDRGRGKIW